MVGQADEVRYRIGLAGQYAAIDPNLTGRENLRLTGRLAQLPAASGGMRRRLDVAAALVQRPPVVFLDKPTPGWTSTAATRCGE